MAKYTTEVRTICEHFAGLDESVGFNDVDEVLDKSYSKIFTNFEIFDELYRPTLCKKILKHFYTREIGAESFGLWKLQLNRRMEEIMPYFNQLYLSTKIPIDPLKNYKGGTIRDLTKLVSASSDEVNESTQRVTGTVDHLHTGGYTDTDQHTNNHVKSGNKTNVNTGGVDTVKSGNETNIRTGAYTAENTKDGATVDTRSGKSGDVTTSFVDLFTDTPQGNIDNMGDGYHLPDGTPTSVPIVGTNTAYLTTAEKTTKSVSDRQVVENSRTYSDDYKDTTTTSYDNLTDTKTYNNTKEAKDYRNLTDTETYNNITDADTFNGTVTRVHNNDDVLDTYNTTKTDNGTINKTSNSSGNDREAFADDGYRGISESELLELYRKTFINVDMEVIKKLDDLFMLVW